MNEMEKKTEPKSDAEKRAREGRILAIVFGTVIVALIAAMYFIDYYVQSKTPGPHAVRDAAEN